MPKLNLTSIDVLLSDDSDRCQLACKSNHSTVSSLPAMDSRESITSTSPEVAILLCTYHGQRYLPEQLASFEVQSHSNWKVWASDDGSEDGTHAILDAYSRKWPEGRLSICSGPSEGFAANFISLACKDSIQADFYAYSDQDDIWNVNKLARAVQWLETVPVNIPALYCSRTRLVDSDDNEIGISPLFVRPPSFANALMQNIGGGNTMVFNNAARELFCEAGENTLVVAHDWWAYIAVTGCGGQVFYDREPTLRYRQHNGNLIGTNSNWSARFKRIHMLFQGEFRRWSDINIAALGALEHKLTPENREILQRFASGRKMSLIPRLIQFKRAGIYRQTLFSNFGLVVAAIFGKV